MPFTLAMQHLRLMQIAVRIIITISAAPPIALPTMTPVLTFPPLWLWDSLVALGEADGVPVAENVKRSVTENKEVSRPL